MVNRRKFSQCLIAVTLSVFMAAGCPSAQQWFQIIGALLPIIGQTYLQFYGFTQKGGVDAGDIAKVQALTSAGQDALNQLGQLVSAYQSAPSNSVVTQMQAVIGQMQNSVNAFLTDAQIKNSANFQKYSLFANAILADVVDILGLVPAISGNVTKMRVGLPTAKTYQAIFQARLDSVKQL